MDAKNIEKLTELGGKYAKRYLFSLYQILSNPKTFLGAKDLNSTEEFISASKFAVFVSILGLVIAYPSFRIVGVEAESPYFLLVDTVITYAFFFLYGSMYHIFAKILRGKGSFQGSVVVFLYLTAFFPVIQFFSMPIDFVSRSLIMDANGILSQKLFEEIAHLHRGKMTMLVSSACLSLGVLIYYAKSLCSGYRMLHSTGRFRAFIIVSLGIVGWQAVSVFLATPIVITFHKSFQQAIEQ